MKTLEDRASYLTGRYDTLKQGHQYATDEVARLRKELGIVDEAATLLVKFAEGRRTEGFGILAWSATEGLQQVFPEEDYSVVIGDPESDSAKAAARVMLVDNGFIDGITESGGRSSRNITEFCLWLQLFWMVLASGQRRERIVFIDEPFTNLQPERYAMAQSIIEGCATLGIQVVMATNYEEMVPERATVVGNIRPREEEL